LICHSEERSDEESLPSYHGFFDPYGVSE